MKVREGLHLFRSEAANSAYTPVHLLIDPSILEVKDSQDIVNCIYSEYYTLLSDCISTAYLYYPF